MKKNNHIKTLLSLLLFVFVYTGCNEPYDNLLTSSYPDADKEQATKQNKVLYVLIDDLPGDVVGALREGNQLPRINELTRRAVYSFNGISEARESFPFVAPNGWANLMTGVMSRKHQVIDDFEAWNETNFPSILERYHGTKTDGKSAIFSTSNSFVSLFAAQQTETPSFGDETQMKSEVLDRLGNSDEQFVVVHLDGLSAVLSANGRDYEGQDYIDKVQSYDVLIGQLWAAVAERETFADEDWLFVVSSSNGGVQSGTLATIYDDHSRNTFVMIYNPKFESKYFARPTGNVMYADSAIRFVGVNSRGRLTDASQYNFGQYGNHTVQLIINAGTVPRYYPTFMAKRAEAFTGSGWQMFMAGTGWEFRAANMSQGFIAGGQIIDGEWHVLTVVFDGTNREIRTYTDGVHIGTGTMNATNLSNDVPLSVGQIGTSYTDSGAEFRMNNVQIYERAFTTEEVQAVFCKTEIDELHPFYDDLIGYWKGNQFGKNVLKEELGSGNDFVMAGPYVWDTFSAQSDFLCPPVNDTYYYNVPNSVDLPFMIFNWLGLGVEKSWQWDGRGLSLPYAVLNN